MSVLDRLWGGSWVGRELVENKDGKRKMGDEIGYVSG